jgi:hypothetical protein
MKSFLMHVSFKDSLTPSAIGDPRSESIGKNLRRRSVSGHFVAILIAARTSDHRAKPEEENPKRRADIIQQRRRVLARLQWQIRSLRQRQP